MNISKHYILKSQILLQLNQFLYVFIYVHVSVVRMNLFVHMCEENREQPLVSFPRHHVHLLLLLLLRQGLSLDWDSMANESIKGLDSEWVIGGVGPIRRCRSWGYAFREYVLSPDPFHLDFLVAMSRAAIPSITYSGAVRFCLILSPKQWMEPAIWV